MALGSFCSSFYFHHHFDGYTFAFHVNFQFMTSLTEISLVFIPYSIFQLHCSSVYRCINPNKPSLLIQSERMPPTHATTRWILQGMPGQKKKPKKPYIMRKNCFRASLRVNIAATTTLQAMTLSAGALEQVYTCCVCIVC